MLILGGERTDPSDWTKIVIVLVTGRLTCRSAFSFMVKGRHEHKVHEIVSNLETYRFFSH